MKTALQKRARLQDLSSFSGFVLDVELDDGPGSAFDLLCLLSFGTPNGIIPYFAKSGSFKTSRADGLNRVLALDLSFS